MKEEGKEGGRQKIEGRAGKEGKKRKRETRKPVNVASINKFQNALLVSN